MQSNTLNKEEDKEEEVEINNNMTGSQNDDEIEYNDNKDINQHKKYSNTNSFPNYYNESNQFEYYTFQGEMSQDNILTNSKNNKNKNNENEQENEILQNKDDNNSYIINSDSANNQKNLYKL